MSDFPFKDYPDMPDSLAEDRELTERAKVASNRIGDVYTMQDNLDDLERYYRGVIWQEAGGMSVQRTGVALRAAEAVKRSMDVFIQDLERRVERDSE